MHVISDTHFNHNNIIKHLRDDGSKIRPFDTVQQMNETIVSRWNAVVSPSDTVWHLGDVFFGPTHLVDPLLSRLAGNKMLIIGNHDDLKRHGAFYSRHFKRIQLWHKIWINQAMVTLSHLPLALDQSDSRHDRIDFNVHGHVHDRTLRSSRHLNVSCEAINFAPVNIFDLIKKAQLSAK